MKAVLLSGALLALALAFPGGARSGSPNQLAVKVYPGSTEDVQLIQNCGVLEDLAELNQRVCMTNFVTVSFGNLGRPNAAYSPSNHSLVFGYELLTRWRKLLAGQCPDQDQLQAALGGLTRFTLYHEFGHCLSHEAFTFPSSLGRPEDAADDFAVMMSHGRGNASLGVEWAARWFTEENKQDRKDVPLAHFMDPHSSMKDRGANLLALLYGVEPKPAEEVATQLGIPHWRLERGSTDYPKKKKMWQDMLASHLEGSGSLFR